MSQDQRQHLEALYQLKLRRLRELEKQAALSGLNVAPQIPMEIQDLQADIAGIETELGMVSVARFLRDAIPDFFGRQGEIEQIVEHLSQAAQTPPVPALYIIQGMGGIGKTELAFAAAQRLVSLFPHGQVLVELRNGVAAPAPVEALQTVIRAFDYQGQLPDQLGLLQGIYQNMLRGRRCLILADDAADVSHARVLVPPPGCALLVTSRQHFTLPGMKVLRLDTLPAEDAREFLLSICPRIGNSAAQLAQLCGYLPLALRVSANVLLNDSTQRLDRYLKRLTNERTKLGSLRDPDDRALDVEASLSLSYAALDTSAQRTLNQISVFPVSFDLVTAQAAVRLDDPDADIEPLLSHLYRRSLLEWEELHERYHLHQLVRLFAIGRSDPDDHDRVLERLAQYYIGLIETKAADLESTRRGETLLQLEREHDNVRVVLAWAQQVGRVELAVLGSYLWTFWDAHGHLTEGRSWLNAALALDLILPLRALVLFGAGTLAGSQSDYPQARILFQESLEIWRSLGQTEALAPLLANLGVVASRQGEYVQANAWYEEALEGYRALGEELGVLRTICNLGSVALDQGQIERAEAFFQEITEALREPDHDNPILQTILQTNLGRLALVRGDYQQAGQHFEASLTAWRAFEDPQATAGALKYLGDLAWQMGDKEEARTLYIDSFALVRQVNDLAGMAETLDGLALVAVDLGQMERAALLYSVTARMRSIASTPRTPANQPIHEQALARIRERLGEDAFAAAYQAGQTLDFLEFSFSPI